MRKVFLVDVVEPLETSQKRHSCTSYYVLSSSERQAEATVRQRLGLTEEHFVRVGEFDDDGQRDFVFQRRRTWWSAHTLAKAKRLALPAVFPQRRLGPAQKQVLTQLAERPFPQGGWVYKSVAQTLKVLDTLRKYDLVRIVDGAYALTDRGQNELKLSSLNSQD